jgi:hypothetical protein
MANLFAAAQIRMGLMLDISIVVKKSAPLHPCDPVIHG